MNTLYPLALKLTHKKVVIIGGGKVALRKARGLENTGATLVIVAKEFLPEFGALKACHLIERAFEDRDIEGAHLIYIATNDQILNAKIAAKAQDWQWVNDVSNPRNSSFYTPAVVREAGLVVGISTEDSDPIRAKQYKRKIADFLQK